MRRGVCLGENQICEVGHAIIAQQDQGRGRLGSWHFSSTGWVWHSNSPVLHTQPVWYGSLDEINRQFEDIQFTLISGEGLHILLFFEVPGLLGKGYILKHSPSTSSAWKYGKGENKVKSNQLYVPAVWMKPFSSNLSLIKPSQKNVRWVWSFEMWV